MGIFKNIEISKNILNRVVISLIILVSLFTFGYRLLIVNVYSPDLAVGEDNNVWNVQKMLLGESLYKDPENIPFEVFQYSPISQYPIFWVSKLLGFKPGEDVHEIYVVGRSLVLLYDLVLVYLIFASLSLLGLNKRYSLLLGLSFFIYELLYRENLSIRPDSLYLLFFLCSIFIFLKYVLTFKRINLIWFSLLLTLTIFTKQSGIILIPIALTYFIFSKSWKDLFFWMISFTGIFGMFLGFFVFLYPNQFIENVIGGVSLPIDLIHCYQVIDETSYNILIPLFFVLVFSTKWIIFNSDKLKLLVGIAVLGTFSFAILTSLKIGSGPSYYNEFILVSILAIGILISNLNNEISEKFKSNLILYSSSFTLFFCVIVITKTYFHKYAKDLNTGNKEHYMLMQKFSKGLKNISQGNYLFSGDKFVKNFIIEKSILPNTEFYGLSKWSYSNLHKLESINQLYLFVDLGDPMHMRILNQFEIKIENYREIKKVNNIGYFQPINK